MLGEGEALPGQGSQRPGNTELLIKRHGRAWPGKEIRKYIRSGFEAKCTSDN